MHYFLISPDDIKSMEVTIKGKEFNHLSRVLRLRVGAEVVVFDGMGVICKVRLTQLLAHEARGEIIEYLDQLTEPLTPVVLVQGLPKGNKMDLIVQKCTELGVNRIVPVETERAVVKLSADKACQRQARWQKIAQEAAKQCRRSLVPVIDPVTTWGNVFTKLLHPHLSLILWEEECKIGLKQILCTNTHLNKTIYIFIGPEGGFSKSEVELAKKAGVIPVSLGPRILRTETAGLAAITMILYQWGDLGGPVYDGTSGSCTYPGLQS